MGEWRACRILRRLDRYCKRPRTIRLIVIASFEQTQATDVAAAAADDRRHENPQRIAATLDAIKAKPARVCPLVCAHGYKADGDGCVKITGVAGSFINNDNECGKSQKRPTRPEVKRDQKPDAKPQRTASEPSAKPQASGQLFCGRLAPPGPTVGCRPIRKGCHIGDLSPVSGGQTVQGEVCN